MSLQQRITGILQKLADPDCVALAEKEIKNLIIAEVDDGEKLNVLIGCIGDDRDAHGQKNRRIRYSQLKFFIAIAEIFQHQILEFLPRVFAMLNKKIRDGDPDIADIVADTYGGITLFAYRGAEEQDANYVFAESVNLLIELFERGTKVVQTTSALCLTKIVQNCQIEILKTHFENLYDAISRVLGASSVKSPLHIFECVLSLILSVQEKVAHVVPTLPDILMRFVAEEDPKTRKICIDIFYSILVINKSLLSDIEGGIYELLQSCKTDKNKSVRETAVECLKLVKPSPSAGKKGPTPRETAKEGVHSKKPTSNQVDSQNQSRGRISSNRKLGIVNQKLDLEHVHSTIDKAKINRQFLKNQEQQEETVVLFKEPRIRIAPERPRDEPERRSPSRSKSPIAEKGLHEVLAQNSNDRVSPPEAKNFNDAGAERTKMNGGISPLQNLAKNNISEAANQDQFSEEDLPQVEKADKQAIRVVAETPDTKANRMVSQQPSSNDHFYKPLHQPISLVNNENVGLNYQQPFASPEKNSSETAFLRNYVNVLNNKISDFQGVIINLQNSNAQLTSRVFGLEKELYELKGFLQKNEWRGNGPQPPAYNNFVLGTDHRARGFDDPGFKQGQFSFGEYHLRRELDPATDLHLLGNNIQQNRWLTRSTASVNETLFEILSLPNPAVQESQLIAFLRTHANLKLFSSIDQTLLDKLLEKLLDFLSRSSSQNLILAEHIMRWIEKYITFNKIAEVGSVKRLYNILVWVQNQFDDEILTAKITNVLSSSVFRAMRRAEQDERGEHRNPSKRVFGNDEPVEVLNPSGSRNRLYNMEHPRQETRSPNELISPHNFESEVIDFTDRFNVRRTHDDFE